MSDATTTTPEPGQWVRINGRVHGIYTNSDDFAGQIVPVASSDLNGFVESDGSSRVYVQGRFLVDKDNPNYIFTQRVYVRDWTLIDPPLDQTVALGAPVADAAHVFGKALARLADEMEWCDTFDEAVQDWARAVFQHERVRDVFLTAVTRNTTLDLLDVKVPCSPTVRGFSVDGAMVFAVDKSITYDGVAEMRNDDFAAAVKAACREAFLREATQYLKADRENAELWFNALPLDWDHATWTIG